MKTHILVLTTAIILANSNPGSPVSQVSETKSIKKVQNVDFAFFRTHRQGKLGVTATWGVNTVDGITTFLVQKTYQDPTDPYSFWEDVTNVACNASRSFKHTDENVFPGQIYYRIVAQLADGTSVASAASGVKITQH